jgi:plasmid stabilization system protein ParE
VGAANRTGSGEPEAKTVAQVVYSANALEKLERALTALPEEGAASASDTARAIQSAVDNLREHPLVGRRVEDDLRELVISFGATGYIALYRFLVQRDEVRVLALRPQREIGYLP